jgi:hypothetical protein
MLFLSYARIIPPTAATEASEKAGTNSASQPGEATQSLSI